MEQIKNLAVVLGIVISLGSVFTVTLPGVRGKIKERLTRYDALWDEMRQLRRLLEAHVQNDTLRETDDAIQREVDVCVLRDLITTIYYNYAKEKKIPVFAMEDVSALYRLYEKRGGNSYVQVLMRQITEEWEVV